MDSRIGLDYIVENKEYTAKLASALDTDNATIKKQVFELLSALCVYSPEGYSRSLDALEHYKILKCERYRFKIVLNELQTDTSLEYKTALVAFINCIIISTPQLKDRIRIRNEFIGLKVLDEISRLRRDAVAEGDLEVQLNVFEEQRDIDEAQVTGPAGVDLNSHLDVFYSILRQVAETPQEIPFLNILQHMLRIDSKEPISDVIWDTAEKLIHRATLLENVSDSARLLRAPSHKSINKLKGEGRCLCSCHREDSKSRRQSLHLQFNSVEGLKSPPILSPQDSIPPPPPAFPSGGIPPPPPPGGPPPPPPPGGPPPPPPPGGAPPPPPGGPPPPPGAPASAVPAAQAVEKIRLPQMATPRPKTKMKTFNWNKIPNSKIIGRNNIWANLARNHEGSPNECCLDWEKLEDLFCQQNTTGGGTSSNSKGNSVKETPETERKKKENSEIVLLDGKRSLNVNIFLKQFRVSNEEIMSIIKDGEHSDIGAEKLRGLLKLLPESDELEMLKSFSGDKSKLATAEKFLLQLMDVSYYKLRIEAMLLKEEFEATIEQIEPSVNALIYASRDLLSNSKFHEVLYMVLVAGNFLNNGGYAGDAGGMKLSSLQKLTDIRANKPGVNLLHYVVMQAKQKNPELLGFYDEMSCLEEATKTTITQVSNEISQMDTRIQKLTKQLENPKCPSDILQQMGDFLRAASADLETLKQSVEECNKMKQQVAEYFCEDPEAFKLAECLKIVWTFCSRIKRAVAENQKREKEEKEAVIRRQNRQENAKRRSYHQDGNAKQPRPGSFSGSESEVNIMDNILLDIRSGFPNRKYGETIKNKKYRKRDTISNGALISEDENSLCNSPQIRRRVESFSNPTQQTDGFNITDKSPDITPNGSMRRRRSRVPSEEDDHKLMDYLQTAGYDETRERGSFAIDGYGSLDRSFSKRARANRGRNRSAYLATESDRERPGSPSKSVTQLNGSGIHMNESPRNNMKKIESWLHNNEKEEQNTKLKRRFREHRKSLEIDTSHDEAMTPNGPTPIESDRKTSDNKWRNRNDGIQNTVKSDVFRTMEAIEEAQVPPPKEKDKSYLRKSNLNVANSSEATFPDDTPTAASRRIRRNRSRSNIEPSHVAQAIDDSSSEVDPQSRRSSLIQQLGNKEAADTISLYIRRPSEEVKIGESIPEKAEVAPESTDNTEKKKKTDDERQSKFLERIKQPTNVSADVLKTIDEVDKMPSSPRVEKKQKKPYQRNLTPSTLRNALQETLLSSLDTSHFEGTIRSLKEDDNDDKPSPKEDQKVLPPSIPKYLRKISKEEDTTETCDADADNIETPPVPRRTGGNRPFISVKKNWATNVEPDDHDDFVGRRNVRRYRSLNSEDRRALVGEVHGKRNLRTTDTSENEGEFDDRSATRRSLRFKHLAALAKDCDSETEKMLASQKKQDVDEDFGDGNFNRFSSARKTLRHKKGHDKGDKSQEDSQSSDSPLSNAIRNSPLRETTIERSKERSPRLESMENVPTGVIVKNEEPAPETWREKIVRKLKNADSYNVSKNMKEQKTGDIKAPATERLHRKNREGLARGSELRGSFRSLSAVDNKRDTRNKSAIDAPEVKSALEKEKKLKQGLKMDLKERFSGGFRRNGSLTKSSRDKFRSSAGKHSSTSKDEKDEGFEDTISVKSETNSQGASSTGGDIQEGNTTNVNSITPSINKRIIKSAIRDDKNILKSNSRGSLKSSRSSLTSGTSMNTVLAARPVSNSASNASIVSNKSDSIRSRSTSSFLDSSSKGLGDRTKATYPASSRLEVLSPSYYPQRTQSNTSLHSSGEGSLPRPVSRNNSVGSSGRQSSDNSLKRTNRTKSAPSPIPRTTINSAKRPLTTSKTKNYLPNGNAKIKRDDSGSFKENLQRSSSGGNQTANKPPTRVSSIRAPLVDRSASLRSTPTKTENIIRRRPNGTRASRVPAFMRPTTSSSSKVSATGAEPVKKVKVESRNVGLSSRPLFK